MFAWLKRLFSLRKAKALQAGIFSDKDVIWIGRSPYFVRRIGFGWRLLFANAEQEPDVIDDFCLLSDAMKEAERLLGFNAEHQNHFVASRSRKGRVEIKRAEVL